MASYKDFNWIIFLDGSAYSDMFFQIFAELETENNIHFVIDSPRKKKIKKILAHPKVRDILNDKLDFLTYEKNKLFYKMKELCKEDRQTIVLFTNSGLGFNGYFPYTLLKYKTILPNIKFAVLYLDIYNGDKKNTSNILFSNGVFDEAYTIEKTDAEVLGMRLVWTPYSYQTRFNGMQIVRDLYFCGASKGRNKILSDIAGNCMKNHVNSFMEIVSYEDDYELRKFSEIIKVKCPDEYETYSFVLKKELESNCILDIVQSGQKALTLRPYEAVVYNKKILTNNESIVDFPFYNSKYIQIIKDVNEIDWEWVKKREVVDYGYNGEFSPLKLLEKIVSDLKL